MTNQAAIYCRKSTDDSDRNPEARSTAAQVERATKFAQEKGWEVNPAHVYIDEGSSGAEWQQRHQLNKLLQDIGGKELPFAHLIVMELSRIGRDSIRTPMVIQEIEESGVTIWSYGSGARISVADETGEIMTMVTSLAASMERRKHAERGTTHAWKRAESGFLAGAIPYGYRIEQAGGFKKQVVDDDQAEIVRRIFRMVTEELLGVKAIASMLNQEGLPGPRGKGWSDGGVDYMLKNDAYTGRVRFGRVRSVYKKGTRKQIAGDPSRLIDRMDESLRIVTPEVWGKAQALRASRGGVQPDIRVSGRNRYLLSGHSVCSACGGPVRVQARGYGHGAKFRMVRVYICSTRESKGAARCSNAFAPFAEKLEAAVVARISEFLDETILMEAVERALVKLQERSSQAPVRKRELEAELRGVESQLGNLVKAIATGKAPASIVAAISELEARQGHIKAEVEGLERKVASLDRERIRKQLRVMVKDTKAILASRTRQSRGMLHRLLGGGKLTVSPLSGGRKGVRFSGVLAFGGLLEGELATSLEAGTGSGSSTSRGRMGHRVEPGQGAAGPAHSLPDGSRASARSRASD